MTVEKVGAEAVKDKFKMLKEATLQKKQIMTYGDMQVRFQEEEKARQSKIEER